MHGAGGMEWHNGGFYVIGGLPATHQRNYVYEYDANLDFVKRHEIASGQTYKGIQTACRGSDGNWWFGCYGSPTVLLRTDDSFKLLGIYQYNTSVGLLRTGDASTFLVAKNNSSSGGHVGSLNQVALATMTANQLPAPRQTMGGLPCQNRRRQPRLHGGRG